MKIAVDSDRCQARSREVVELTMISSWCARALRGTTLAVSGCCPVAMCWWSAADATDHQPGMFVAGSAQAADHAAKLRRDAWGERIVAAENRNRDLVGVQCDLLPVAAGLGGGVDRTDGVGSALGADRS